MPMYSNEQMNSTCETLENSRKSCAAFGWPRESSKCPCLLQSMSTEFTKKMLVFPLEKQRKSRECLDKCQFFTEFPQIFNVPNIMMVCLVTGLKSLTYTEIMDLKISIAAELKLT